MNLLRLSLLFFSLNSFSGYIGFDDKLDEFTDEREISLGIIADDGISTPSKFIAISCIESGEPRMFLQPGLAFSTKSNLSVTYRFEKNEPGKQVFRYESQKSFLYTFNLGFIQKFLDDLRISDNFILRIEGSSEIMRFSDLYESKTNVSKFVNAASEMAFDCPLF
tara:strand:- start:63 stop:557 length:495 start_codon:yes stop_codon:yes gene_type:complete